MTIVDNVILNGERLNTRSELRPQATHPELFGQRLESINDGVNEPVGGLGAGVLGDVGPDFVEIPLGER